MGARMSEPAAQYEASRLTALARYAVLDTEREAIFDQFAAMTAQLLEKALRHIESAGVVRLQTDVSNKLG